MADTPATPSAATSTPGLESLTWWMTCSEPLSPLSYPADKDGKVTIEGEKAAAAWKVLAEKNPALAEAIGQGRSVVLAPLNAAFLRGDFNPVMATVWDSLYKQQPAWRKLSEKERVVPKVSSGSRNFITLSDSHLVRVTVLWDTTGVDPNPDNGSCDLNLEFTWARSKIANFIDKTFSHEWAQNYLPPDQLVRSLAEAVNSGDLETTTKALLIAAGLHNHPVEGKPFILREAGSQTDALQKIIATQVHQPRFEDSHYRSALLAASMQLEMDSDGDGHPDWKDRWPRSKIAH